MFLICRQAIGGSLNTLGLGCVFCARVETNTRSSQCSKCLGLLVTDVIKQHLGARVRRLHLLLFGLWCGSRVLGQTCRHHIWSLLELYAQLQLLETRWHEKKKYPPLPPVTMLNERFPDPAGGPPGKTFYQHCNRGKGDGFPFIVPHKSVR